MDNNMKPEKKQALGYAQREFVTYIQPTDRSEWPLFQAHSGTNGAKGFDSPEAFYRYLVKWDNDRVLCPRYKFFPYWIRREPSEYGAMTDKQKNTKSIMDC